MSDRMEQLIQEHRLIPPGSTVLCAVSGGADSVYLLHRLYCLRRELDFTLVAAHYDHRLRGAESTQDAKFVEEFVRLCCPAERLYTPEGPGKELPGVRLITGGGDVAGEAARLRQGLEETARQMRYAFLQAAAQEVGANLIATAHNASDNAETVLLHLGRGSGLRGLAGMPPKRGNLIRPLLTTSREEIENYLRPQPAAPPGATGAGGPVPWVSLPHQPDLRPPAGGRGLPLFPGRPGGGERPVGGGGPHSPCRGAGRPAPERGHPGRPDAHRLHDGRQ